MVNYREPSEKHILRIAKEHFIKHGFVGARMQAIADDAGVNKALLHYYYQNKDGLFQKVFKEEGLKMIQSTTRIIEQSKPFIDKIQEIIVFNIDHLLKNPELPMFMMREMARDPSLMQVIELREGEELFKRFLLELNTAQKKNEVGKHVDMRDLLINLDALVMYPFIASAFCRQAFHFTSTREYTLWLKERKKKLPIFIKQALLPIK